MWNLSSPTRNRTFTPCRFLTTGPPGKYCSNFEEVLSEQWQRWCSAEEGTSILEELLLTGLGSNSASTRSSHSGQGGPPWACVHTRSSRVRREMLGRYSRSEKLSVGCGWPSMNVYWHLSSCHVGVKGLLLNSICESLWGRADPDHVLCAMAVGRTHLTVR